MQGSDALLEYANSHAPPGTLLKEESFKGLEEHPNFSPYIDQMHAGKVIAFRRQEIMDEWTDKPLISFGFQSCYPLIANKPPLTEAQAIHVSRDPWFETDTEKLRERVGQWKKENDKILMLTTPHSAFGREVNEWPILFRQDFIFIPTDIDSRFAVVFDVRKQLLLVQFSDAKLLRVYKGFSK